MNDSIHVRDRLDDFIDDLLPDEERRGVLGHLERCADCQADAEGLLALRSAARALPREITPPRELWAGIAARLEPRGAGAAPAEPPRVIAVDFRNARRGAWRRWAAVAAAAVVLVTFSSGLTAYLMRARGAAPMAAAPVEESRAQSAFVAFQPSEAEFVSTVDLLEAALDARRDRLSPETIATVEANLAIIDQAIEEARVALLADPANADLPLHLSSIYQQKVKLLQSAVQLPEMST